MSASTSPSSVTQGLGEAFLRDLMGRDTGAALARLHDHVQWVVPGDPQFGGGVHQGREKVLRFFALVGALFPSGLRIAELEEWPSEGGFVIEATLEGETAAGVDYRNDYAFVIEMDGPIVMRVREYTDTSHAERLLRTGSGRCAPGPS